MYELIYIYLLICVLALCMKYVLKFVRQLRHKELTHAEEHSITHFIKIAIILLMGIIVIILLRHHPQSPNYALAKY